MREYFNCVMTDDEGHPHLEKVLILDDDLGFVFWLGHLLDATGYSALPAKSVPDAALLLLQLDAKIDLVVINLALAGAIDFLAALHRSQRDIRVVGILDDPVEATGLRGVNTVRSRPSVLNEPAKVEWLQCVQHILANYDTAVY
jgi:response regulator RpfG family c-di-GMP phosphodiesterase